MADAIIEELWRVKNHIAREAGYDVKTLAAAIRGARDRKPANRGEPSGMRKVREPVANEDAGSDSGSPEIAPAV